MSVIKSTLAGVISCLSMLSLAAMADPGRSEIYSPFADVKYPENVYWGDTHLHTSRSPDAYSLNNRLDPEVAYRFARGETVLSQTGQRVRIRNPLDFLVVTDHAEAMGVFSALDAGDPDLITTELGKRWYRLYQEGKRTQVLYENVNTIRGTENYVVDDSFRRSVWQDVISDAEKYNDTGKFTAFIGYEWTSLPNGNNLHRNIIFRDGGDRAGQVIPFGTTESFDPEKLWQWMAAYEDKTGGRLLAIPHNGNLSNGTMFSDKTYSGEALTRKYAETRSRWEPLYEVTQVKGDAETHPYLSPDDGFADFETWDMGNIGPIPKEKWMLQYEYARSALKLGLKHEADLGVNPFKFGMIGGTDNHTSLSTTSENNFFGKMSTHEPAPGRANEKSTPSDEQFPLVGGLSASGLAAVWARENTRESIFDAMRRKEAYATTGTRITLRFFGGWDFDKEAADRPDYVRIGYEKGVPMGSDLVRAPEGQVPQFLIVASKDPDGANLERVQVVKGWLDHNGVMAEKVYDVALAGETGQGAKQTADSIDTAVATYLNTAGAPSLSAVWTDSDFDPNERAFYYVRVLEIPTPRWTTYDAVYFNKPLPGQFPAEIQERAYSSPIWYSP